MLFRARTLGGAILVGVCGLSVGCQSTQFGAAKSTQEPAMMGDNAPAQPQSTSSKFASFFHYSGDDAAAKHNAEARNTETFNADPQPQSSSKIASFFQWKPKGSNSVNSTSEPPQQQMVLRQGNEIQWSVNTAQDQPGLVKSGTGVVAPDGTAEIGPYGTVRVAGMNLTQATGAVEKQLGNYMQTPSVQLSAVMSDNSPTATRNQRFTGQPTYGSATMIPSQTVTNTTEPELQPVTWRPSVSGN